MPSRLSPLHVLLIENSEDEIRLIQGAFAELPAPVQLHVARTGAQAHTILTCEPRIALVLLDHQLPGEDSLGWLENLKRHNDMALRRLPVVMLSANDTEEQIRKAYYSYASAYLIKPGDPLQLRQMLTVLVQFWGQVARLPERA
ncbi:hypothetical protein DKM44_00485 [Deinococcus irradiatisoli]|uniref:Response regulatory domain-containing protein n=1 Tax=Deinococcus irradiatisoli TaxID=2202254 RepID=A0A2Z3JET2_9DEIO|nr:response regulator [Deinococcus irradiatisoli]AWN21900.1 hypothetical protein DKM44_00485 [Deinococcus irradiatisoli]